jgi:hypothetical protein
MRRFVATLAGMRRLLAAFLAIALCWQSMAAVGAQGAVLGSAQDVAHTALHWLDSGHHHHDDGTYHEDESSESTQHLMADSAIQVSALLPHVWRGAGVTGSASPPLTAESIGPAPFIDGPRRPPRLLI